jgi:hypothetical protein
LFATQHHRISEVDQLLFKRWPRVARNAMTGAARRQR